jgi:hypothetical protein
VCGGERGEKGDLNVGGELASTSCTEDMDAWYEPWRVLLPDSEPVIIRGSTDMASISGVLAARGRDRPERA